MEFVNIKENEIEVVRGDKPYKEREGGAARHSLRYILGDLGDIKQKYFNLGFHLNEFAQNEYYKDFGYDSMKEFCLANIPIEYSSLSRCMSVHKHVCERSNNVVFPLNITNRMKDKYKEYGYSQLVEMVGMSENEEKLCAPDMTVKEIRELRKQIREKQKDSQVKKSDNCDVATMEKACKRFINCPSDFLVGMFKQRFGEDLPVVARGKMLEMKISNYEVTIRISFKELEQTEE